MNKFVILRARNKALFERAKDRLRNHALHVSSVWPTGISYKEWEEANVLVLTLENSQSGGIERDFHYQPTGDDFFVYDGLPYFSDLDADARWAPQVRALFEENGAQELQQKCFGQWALCDISGGKLRATTDFCGLTPLFYFHNSDYFAISTRQFLLGVSCHENGAVEIDGKQLSWLTGQANLIGDRGAVAGVKHLPPAAMLSIDLFSPTSPPEVVEDQFWTERSELSDAYHPDEVSGVVDAWQAQMDAFARLPVSDMTVDLSGGLDSRLVTALAWNSDLKDKVQRFRTNGPAGGGEIEVAKVVAGVLGLPHQINLDGVDKPHFKPEAIFSALKHQIFRFESSICPVDAWAGATSKSRLLFTGACGEIYRRHCKPHMNVNLQTTDELRSTYASYHTINDPIGVQRKRISDWQVSQMQTLAKRYYDDGAGLNEISDIFYMRYRLPLWNGLMFNNIYSGFRVSPLANYAAAKLAFSKSYKLRTSSALHFEALARIQPELAAAPVLDFQWSPDVIASAQARGLGIATEPYPSGVRKTLKEMMPQAQILSVEGWDLVQSYCLDQGSSSGFFELYNREAIEHHTAETASKGITQIKEVGSLAGAAMILASDYDPKFEGDTSRTPELDIGARGFFGDTPMTPDHHLGKRVRFSLAA